MTPRDIAGRPAEPLSLPIFARLAPALPAELIAARIEAATAPDDVVVDLFGRGGWVARAALALGRRAVSIETSPLSRLLADVVLRAPDLRHLDAAFQAVAAAPLGTTSLRAWIDEGFATGCPTCGRTLALEEMVWEPAAGGALRPTRRSFRCPACLDRRGRGGELRHAAPEEADLELASAPGRDPVAREEIARRFPLADEPGGLLEQLLDLHSPRQLAALQAILARVEGELRASQVTSALRLALLHAILPSSRLNGYPGRASSLRIVEGRVRPAGAPGWRERNPWRAFEEGYQLVRAFVQALDDGPYGAVQARLTEPFDGVLDGPPMISLRVGAGDALARLAAEAEALTTAQRARVRLVLSQPLPEWTPGRLAEAFVVTAWGLGSEAARLLPFGPLLDADARPPSRGAALRAALDAVAPAMAPDGAGVVLLDADGAPGLVVAGLAGATAGWRVAGARLAEPGRTPGGLVELVPPGGRLGAGPRTRANRALAPSPGGAGDPAVITTRGVFGGPAPIDGRFSVSELNRVVTETAVAALQARGEPADGQHLVGELLVALDRSGQLRRFAVAAAGDAPAGASPPGGDPAGRAAADLLALIEGELGRPDQRKIAPSEGGRFWLRDARDEATAAAPLSDRLEWAVFSLLGTGASVPEAAVRASVEEMFTGPDAPDPWLVDACLASYGVPAPGDGRLVARDDLQARTHEHAATIGLLADLGHHLGVHVFIAPREQGRRAGRAPLGAKLFADERNPSLGFLGRSGADALEQVDCCWYVRPRFTFLFEVEWTAMLGEPVLRRGRSIAADERIVRFLVLPPERVELLRHKLKHSPVLRAAMEAGNWHVLRIDALRRFAARPSPALGDLEPYLGLDPVADRPDQLPLFET
ncbi:MAG TPA: hypothetical protein VER83_01485 [Candidatus Nanopelagicales bacterium]|nr:hypothetical protein [Candidatus Nanopelagicales bacterium]